MFSPQAIIYGVAILGIAYIAGRIVKWVDNRVEARRRKAIDLAGKLNGLGLGVVAEFLTDYAIGDYDTMAAKLVKFEHLVASDAAMREQVLTLAKSLITGQLATPEGKTAVNQMLVDLATRVQTPAAVPAAPVKSGL